MPRPATIGGALVMGLLAVSGASCSPDTPLGALFEPPLARDFRSFCLQSRLDPGDVLRSVNETTNVSNAVSSPPLMRAWRHSVGRHVILIQFYNWRDPNDQRDHGLCTVSDFLDKQATVDWLNRQAGSDIPKRGTSFFFLAVQGDQPRLFQTSRFGGVTPPPAAKGDVYKLAVNSFETSTELSLGR